MDLFVEKEFLEEFELDYDYSEHKSEIQKILYSVLTEYTDARLFLNAPLSFINESRILSLFSNINLDITFEFDIESYFDSKTVPNNQTLVFTREEKDWFYDLRNQGVLCFSYNDYEREIKTFINETTFKIDLSDPEQIPVDWKVFHFIGRYTNFIIVSDPYILNDGSGQKIKENLIPLLKENLNVNHFYSIFIITEVDKDINKKVKKIYSSLKDYKIKIFVFNRIKTIESMSLHDRYLYSNYTITSSGTGFNLNISKPVNSKIESASLFEKFTYKCINNHLKHLIKYINKLEQMDHLDKPYKTNTLKAFESFREVTAYFIKE